MKKLPILNLFSLLLLLLLTSGCTGPEEESPLFYGKVYGEIMFTDGQPADNVDVYLGKKHIDAFSFSGPSDGYDIINTALSDSSGRFSFDRVETEAYRTIWIKRVDGTFQNPDKHVVQLETGDSVFVAFSLIKIWPWKDY